MGSGMLAGDQNQEARRLIESHFGSAPETIQLLSGGFFSQAFAFTVAGENYVIRLNTADHADESFAKDDYAWRHFAGPALPIPRIVATGSIEDGCYAISERAAGQSMWEFSPDDRQLLLPALLDTLEAVGQADVSHSHGYGFWGSDGNGQHVSWRTYLATCIENHPDGYYQNWHQLFRESFLEKEVYETVYRRMLTLSEWCPEERALVHGDFMFVNIISDSQRITGVIDWAIALYGDPLYDVAFLTWHAAHPGWWYQDGDEIIRTRFGSVPNYAERIACYQCHIGLDLMRFYAKHDMADDYQFCRDWLLRVLATSENLL